MPSGPLRVLDCEFLVNHLRKDAESWIARRWLALARRRIANHDLDLIEGHSLGNQFLDLLPSGWLCQMESPSDGEQFSCCR
jgi:hypothetical protein